MDKFIIDFYALCEKHKDERKMAQFIRMVLPAISQARDDKGRFLAEFKDLINHSDPAPVAFIPGEKKALKEVVFTAADFDAPKSQAQVAPPVATEEHGAHVKKSDEREKAIFDLFNAGEDGANEMGLPKFMIVAKDCGCEFKPNTKDIAAAWKQFEKYARKALQI